MNADQKKVYAHMMAVYAGSLSHCDHQIGRVVDAVKEMGELDNTLIIYIQGDNGASAEGNPNGLRTQFHHAIDILPTILEAAGLPQPTSIYDLRTPLIPGGHRGRSTSCPAIG